MTNQLAVIFFFIEFCFGLLGSASAMSAEIFPLKKGLLYTYQYLDNYSYNNMAVVYSTRDSGIIEYLIRDSLLATDSLVIWSVLQIRNVIHRNHDNYRADTTYQISDSVIFNLTESTSGNHELAASSQLWTFPGINRSHDTLHVYRFASGADTVMGNLYYCICCPAGSFDTLWFIADSGFYQAQWDRCYDLDDMFEATDRGQAALTSRTLVSVLQTDLTPKFRSLLTNFPNPFNPRTIISYDIPRVSAVRLTVYDLMGRRITEVDIPAQAPGHYSHEFDGSDLASGVYIVELQAIGLLQTSKMILLK